MEGGNVARLRRVLPFVVAIIFFILGFNRPQQRGVWIALGICSLIIGLGRRKRLE